MNHILEEGELTFNFKGAFKAEKFDLPGSKAAQGWKRADFVVEEEQRTLIVEVKDILGKTVPLRNRERFIKDLEGNTLISEKFVSKFRDTYCHLHLMRRDMKECWMIILLCVGLRKGQEPLLFEFERRLRQRLIKECDEEWKRQYAVDCIVTTESTWREYFKYGLERRD